MSPALRGAFHALQAAIQAGDDDLAEGILLRLEASPLSDAERELTENLRSVLRGRQLSESIVLRLVVQPAAADGAWTLSVAARQDAAPSLELRLPPLRLTQVRERIDARGVGSSETRSQLHPVFEQTLLARGEEVLRPLAEFEVPMRGSLALRDVWELEALAGSLRLGDRSLPAAAIVPARLERVYLADYLPTETVDPEVLAEYARREDPGVPALLERALRISAARQQEALDALEPVLLDQLRDDPTRTVALEPALRWLARTNQPGVDPAAWVQTIRRLRREREDAARARQQADDLESRRSRATRRGLQLPSSDT